MAETKTCGVNQNWCRGLSVVTTLIVVCVSIFGAVAVNLYTKNDTLVEVTVELRYLREDVRDIKDSLKAVE